MPNINLNPKIVMHISILAHNIKLRAFIFTIVILVGGLTTLDAQSIKFIKKQIEFQKRAHVKGQEQFSFGAGIIKNGWNVESAYGKYLQKDWLFRTDVSYETVKINLTTLNAFYLSPEMNYCIKKVNNRFFINAKGGVIAGLEYLNNEIMVNKKISQVVLGEKIGLKLEYFLTPELSMNVDLEQRFINNSQLGTITRNAYLSLSYNF
jgi:hypothetical protein